jgi:hypothetical protein
MTTNIFFLLGISFQGEIKFEVHLKMLFYLIHKLFQTNCLQALGSSLVFGSIIYLFFLFFVKTPIFSLLIPLDLLFTYHNYINDKIGLVNDKITHKPDSLQKPLTVTNPRVILKKLPGPVQPSIESNINRSTIKYVQKMPRMKDTLHFTVQNLGI